jgi:hypothetical protein
MGHNNLALLGVLGLVQTVFLPGYLIVRSLRIGGGLIAGLVLSFGLSLVANYLLVTGLVVLGIYRPAVMYSIFAAELLGWLWLDRRRLQLPLGDVTSRIGGQLRTFLRDIECECPIRSRGLRFAIIGATLAVIVGFAAAGIAEFGRIFQQWDAVVSWNRWAVEWASDRLPQMTSYYPQLLPANDSLSYVFMQTSEVWAFAKAVQFLFCLMLLLAMLDAARRTGNFGLVAGVATTYGLLVALLRYRMLSSGYADAPLAFFSWMPVYALLRADCAKDDSFRFRWLVVGALFAAGAALTKQLSLYVAVVYPLLAWAWAPNRGSLRGTLRLYLLIALLVAPWYLYKLADIRSGGDVNNTSILVGEAHAGRELPARFAHAGDLLADAISLPGAGLLLFAVAASLRDPRSRWTLGLFVVPLGLLWAVAFSYDLRNLAMLAPFVGAAAGTGLVRIVCWAERRLGWAVRSKSHPVISDVRGTRRDQPTRHALRVWHAAGVLFILLIASVQGVRDESLLSLQQRQQRRIGIPDLNERLYQFSASNADQSLIATDYLALHWLPDIGPRSVVCASDDLATFRKSFDRADVRYILVRTAGVSDDVRNFLAQLAAARLLFEEHGYAFYEKIPPSA